MAAVASTMKGIKTHRSLWDRLVAPSARVTALADKRNARLLASILVVIIPMLVLVLITSDMQGLANLTREAAVRLSLIRWSLFVFVLAGYGLSRSRYFRWGGGLALTIIWAMIYASMIQNPNTPYGFGAQILMQIIPILIVSMIFPVRGVVIAYVLIQAATLASPLLIAERPYGLLILPSTVLAVAVAIVVVSMRHRDLLERDRQSEMLKTNADLGRALTRAEQARREAEEADRLKSEFLATMSHELRTPLHAVIGYADVQLAGIAGEMTPAQNEYQERILANATHLLAMINDVLDLSKIEAGRMDLVARAFDLRAWAEDMSKQVAGLASQKKLVYQVNIDDGLPVSITGDAGRLKQIALNLVSNAIKFTEKGSVTVNMKRLPDSQWSITVADTGVGIPAHAKDYIFEEFRQADGSSTRQHGGTGLGLAIVRKLTLLMKGTINVESEIGHGSTFTIQLPLVEATDAPQAVPATEMMEASHVS